MYPENPPILPSASCRRFRFPCRATLLAAFAGLILAFLPAKAHATKYGEISLAQMVTVAELIIVAEIVPTGDEADIKVVEVLKGRPPNGFTFSGSIRPDPSGGQEKRIAWFPGTIRPDPSGEQERRMKSFSRNVIVPLDSKSSSVRHIFLLLEDYQGNKPPTHTAYGKPETEKARILEILKMSEDPAPFVKDGKYVGDTALIHVLGVKFHGLRMEGTRDPVLQRYLESNIFIEKYLPWLRLRQDVTFTFDSSREVPLQVADFKAEGSMADFIRKFLADPGFGSDYKLKEAKLPARFTITLDTLGPGKAGGLTAAEASAFLREQLDSGNEEVVKTAYAALMSMRDTEAVPAAIQMLQHPDLKLRKQAAYFLARARDPRSISAIAAAIDALPPCIRYAHEGYNEDQNQLSKALGQAVSSIRSPELLPALKQATAKGYAGDNFAFTLSQMGDESAFEPMLSHLRNPRADHYPDDLITLVNRSNLPVEDWMDDSFWSEQREEKKRHSERWIAWWEAHKAELRIVRTWEEAYQMK